ncbi:MAG: zinc ABC transporter substrate-binding protein [Armatimonadota bacterium]
MKRFTPVVTICAALSLCLLIALAGCTPRQAPQQDRPQQITAVVSILPQQFFVQRIGGDHVDVEVLVGPGASPATYEPTPTKMAALEEADVYFRINMPFEDSLMKQIRGSFPDLRVVDVSRDIKLRPIDRFETVGAETDEAADHAGQRMDPHVWLDPTLAAKQARTMADVLGELAPRKADTFEENLQKLLTDLDRITHQVANMIVPIKGSEILVFHPAYGYFAEYFGLHQVAIEVEGKSPSPRQLAEILQHARENDIQALFVQPQFSSTAPEAIAAEIGAEVISLDPLAPNYLENLVTMAEKIVAVKKTW